MLFLMLLVALPVAGWELRNLRLGVSNVKLALQQHQWVDEAGYISALGLLRRIYRNIGEFGALGGILTNGPLKGSGSGLGHPQLVAHAVSLALLALGLARSIRRRMAVTDVYCAVYLCTICAYEAGLDVRKLVPIVPLLFYYALAGARSIVPRIGPRLGRLAPAIAFAALLVYTAYFLRAGLREMLWAIPCEHTSPFGTFPVPYVPIMVAQFFSVVYGRIVSRGAWEHEPRRC